MNKISRKEFSEIVLTNERFSEWIPENYLELKFIDYWCEDEELNDSELDRFYDFIEEIISFFRMEDLLIYEIDIFNAIEEFFDFKDVINLISICSLEIEGPGAFPDDLLREINLFDLETIVQQIQ